MANPATTVAAPIPLTRGATTAARGRVRLSLKDRTTPQILWLALGASWLLTLLLFLVSFWGLQQMRAAAQTIGRDSEPSVLAARQIGQSLANMHASVANAFLLGAGHDQEAWATYQQERNTVADTLVNAAQNITYSGEKEQIIALSENFVRYQDLISTASAGMAQNPTGAMVVFGQADDLIHNQLFPEANELARINDAQLTQTYQADRTVGVVMAVVTVLAGLALLVALVATQRFLTRRTRRLFNLPLLGASLLGVILVALVATALLRSNENLRGAKLDAYDSVYALTSARAVSYDANADESLWLVAKDDPRYETAFMNKAKQMSDPLLNDPTVKQLPTYIDGHKPVPFKGFLANELNNITFVGEREGALSAANWWAQYLAIDAQIRTLEHNGDHPGAVALDVGTAQGQSNFAFDNFDKAMQQLIAINQLEFDNSIQQIFDNVGIATFVPILALIIAALVWLGVQPRLAEYR